ncbi:MAG: hypothetical protein JO115_03930 [Pseudonocardiales bacterium]|nr:hypothetical protein [Pseudonocardiales bacterium]
MRSQTTARATPERLAGLIRDHDSTTHTQSGPRVMAALRTLTIEALHPRLRPNWRTGEVLQP